MTHKPKQGTCAYCGTVGNVTLDHVIPQCLWSGRVPKDVPGVDACPQCNNVKKSADDSYLRDVLVNDQDSFHHNIVQKIRPKFQNSAKRNQSAMYKDFKKGGKVIYTQRLSTNLVVPSQVSEEVDKRVIAILSQIVRGLHYHYLNEPLPKDSTFWVGRQQERADIQETAKDIAAFSGEYHRGNF